MRPPVHPRPLGHLVLVLTTISLPAASFDDSEIARFKYPEWFKTTFYDLGDDLADAREAGKQGIVVFFSTTGCSYCKLMLERSFADSGFARRLRTAFDVIGLEMFSDTEMTDWDGGQSTITQFAVSQGAKFSPTLVFFDLEGRRTLRLVGYYDTEFLTSALDYLTSGAGPKISLRDWRTASARSTSSAQPARGTLAADPLFARPPYHLDRSRMGAQQPLLVLFDAAGCADCDEFHRTVLTDPEVRSILQTFEVVRLDAGDAQSKLVTPDGRAVTPAQWYHDQAFSRLPALLVFDEAGRPQVRTDALVRRGRFVNLLGFVTNRAYEQGWNYQRYARSVSIRRMLDRQAGTNTE